MLALRHAGAPTAIGVAAFAWLAGRIVLSWTWRTPAAFPEWHVRRWVARARVGVVIPSYNEDPDAVVRTVRSLFVQTRRPDVVYIVDDGSSSRAGVADLIFRASRSAMEVRVLPMATNRGKRHAQAQAWLDETSCDVWALVDSDTELDPDALERMLEAFADPRVHAATSLILPRNRGLLPALQEIEYARGQLTDRLVLNYLGAVDVISGGFSMVRDHVVRGNLPAYLAGWYGQHIGDDRHLCTMANVTGRVIAVPAARSWTDAPSSLRALIKQRVRWARSPYLAVVWAWQRVGGRRRITLIATALMGARAVAYGFMFGLLVELARHPGMLVMAAAYVAVFSWLRSFRYLAVPHPSPGWQYATWLLAPVSQLFSLVVYVPVQLYALATVRRGGWGTR